MPVPASSILPTLDELKTHLDVTSTTHDSEMQDTLDAAAQLVAQHVGPLDAETVTERHRQPGDPLVLRKSPVVSVSSVTDFGGTAYASTDYTLEPESGLLYLAYDGAYSAWSSSGVTVVYEAGRSTLPRPIAMAILIVAADLWETQMGGGAGVPSYPGAEDDLARSGLGAPVIPPKALQLLEPYMLGPVIA